VKLHDLLVLLILRLIPITLREKCKSYLNLGILLTLLLFNLAGRAQKRMSTEEYIATYKDIAIEKMKEFKIPASITLAQGILESGSGNSKLATEGNNHFGIKCHKGWTGKKIYVDDDELHECFRKYKKAEDSYRDHSLFLTQRGRYSFLFDLEITDYKAWAKGLKQAGYATNPRYPELLIRIIENNNLHQYDLATGQDKNKKTTRKSGKKLPPPMTVAQFEKDERYPSGRQLYSCNGKKLLIAVKGDTFNKYAKEFGLYLWQLYKYNDIDRDYVLKVGDIVYLEKKRRKADKKHTLHKVTEGQTIHSISQLYGVRESRIYKMNNLPKGTQVAAGKVLKLR